MCYIQYSIIDDNPEHAVYGAETCGIVDEDSGGIIAYVHVDYAEFFLNAIAKPLAE